MSPAKLTAICAFVMLMPLLRYIRQIQTDKDTDTDTTAVTVASASAFVSDSNYNSFGMLKNEPHQYKDQQSLYAPPHNMHIKKILYLYLARSCAARATLNYHIEGCCDKVQNNNNASVHIRTR